MKKIATKKQIESSIKKYERLRSNRINKHGINNEIVHYWTGWLDAMKWVLGK